MIASTKSGVRADKRTLDQLTKAVQRLTTDVKRIDGRRGGSKRGGKPKRPAARTGGKKVIDPTVLRYLRAVADPFAGPLSGGIADDAPTKSCAVVRRQNTATINLTTSACLAGGTGNSILGGAADIVVPLLGTMDPTFVVATSDTFPLNSNNAYRRMFGNPSALIPSGAIARCVAAQVRITPTSAADSVGGCVAFWTPPGGSADVTSANSPDLAIGGFLNDLQEAIPPRALKAGQTITYTCPPTLGWFTVDNTNATSGIGETATGTNRTWNGSTPHIRIGLFGLPVDRAQSFLVSVSTITEYYHDTHRSFTRDVVAHPDGHTVVQRVAQALHTERAVTEGTPDHVPFLSRVVSTIRGVGNVIQAGAEVAYGTKKAYDALAGAFEMDAGLAIMAAV